jgi:glycolate oxidase FAD binding subunit
MTPAIIRPTSAAELMEVIADAGESRSRLRIRGGGSKDGMGALIADAAILDMSAFSGIANYDPSELVLTAGAATPLAELVAAVAAAEQALAFDPFDHGPIFGAPAGQATLGGIIAANVSGPRRVARGAARDHFLGFSAVSGRGERFVAGGKVVKNVTGYDLPKLMAGSWGRLAAMTEITIKVLPRPRVTRVLRLHGLCADRALAAMARAMGSPADIAAARHVPGRLGHDGRPNGEAVTEFVIEGFEKSVEARLEALQGLLARDVAPGLMEAVPNSPDIHWPGNGHVAQLAGVGSLWRLLVRPTAAGKVVRELDRIGSEWWMDWAGGLIWTICEDSSARPRQIAQEAGGNAVLVRASREADPAVSMLQPQPQPIAALEERVRRAFDPYAVFEAGRF